MKESQIQMTNISELTRNSTTSGIIPLSDVNRNRPTVKNSKLQECLEIMKKSEKLILGDMFIGDEGALQVAEFLNHQKNFVAIDIRGNDISSAGFKTICDSLKGSTSLTTIYAEWNNIGSDTSGLFALQSLTQSLFKINSIDLRNNQIGQKCILPLTKIIRESRSLKYVDLRWNHIGDDGARDILQALKNNLTNKPKVELGGNRVTDDILVEIETLSNNLEMNKENNYTQLPNIEVERASINRFSATINQNLANNNPITERKTNTNQEHISIGKFPSEFLIQNNLTKIPVPSLTWGEKPKERTTLVDKPRSSYSAQIVNREVKPLQENKNIKNIIKEEQEHKESYVKLREVISNLENIIRDERIKSDQQQDEITRLLGQIETEKKEKHDLQVQYDDIFQTLKERNQQLKDLSFQIDHVNKQNRELKDRTRIAEEDVSRVTELYNIKLREIEEKYQRDVRELASDKQTLKSHIDKIKNQSQEYMQDFQDRYETKYTQYEQELHSLSTQNADLSAELSKQAAYIQALQAKQAEQLRGVVIKIKDEEAQRAEGIRRNVEVEFDSFQKANKQLHHKYLGAIEELNIERKVNSDKQAQLAEESKLLRNENSKLLDEIKELNMVIIQQKGELGIRDNDILKLEDEIQLLNNDIESIKNLYGEKIDRMKRDFMFEKKRYEDNEKQLSAKVINAERLAKEADTEAKKARKEYERVADMVQGNVSKIITDTFLENVRSDLR